VFISLNSINQLIFVMVKCGVLFEVRAGLLNITYASFDFKRLINKLKRLRKKEVMALKRH
jgi:hypothetical protein